MAPDDTWSPDEPLGTETFEQSDETLDEGARLDPEFIEEVLLDPSLDPAQKLDDREVEEAGVELDDPEDHLVLDGDMDDPDGLGGPTRRAIARDEDPEGWELDAPLTPTEASIKGDRAVDREAVRDSEQVIGED